MKKINNFILIRLIFIIFLIAGVYVIVYFKQTRDVVDKTHIMVIENAKDRIKHDSINNLKISIDSVYMVMDDSIINNQNIIIKLLEKDIDNSKTVAKSTVKNKNIFNKIKGIFNKK